MVGGVLGGDVIRVDCTRLWVKCGWESVLRNSFCMKVLILRRCPRSCWLADDV